MTIYLRKSMSNRTKLTIGHLYPEQMSIYGDRGNIITLVQRCAWRGIEAEVVPIGIGDAVDWQKLDIIFFGGGQDSGQALIASDLVQRLGAALKAAIDDGIVLLAICGGYQLLGHYFLTHTGEKLPGVGALDLHTVGGKKRMIGNIVVAGLGAGGWGLGPEDSTPSSQSLAPSPRFVGFENHSGQTYLGAGVQPLGRVLAGYGNNGEDKTEGAFYRNTIGCYMHGSLLPKNPHLADDLLHRALLRRYGHAELTPLDDVLELQAQQAMIAKVVR